MSDDKLVELKSPMSVESTGDVAYDVLKMKAGALANSDLVPEAYKGNVPNCMIALELAERTKSSPFMVMQNVHIIRGRPSWSSSFIIAAINSSGRFSPLRYTLTGEGATRECFAWAKDLSDDEVLEGPVVSMEMAKAEGWLSKSGSKWKTMPELMLRYRAASFFGRLHAPEILMGMQTVEENWDVHAVERPSVTDALDTLRDVTPEPVEGETGTSSPALLDEPPEDHSPTAYELEADGE